MLVQGIVSNIKDPDKRGRIKCRIPSVLGSDVESAWCEPCVPVAFDNGGDFYVPPVDEAVWIAFKEDDVNQPVYLGGWWSKEKTPIKNYDLIRNTRIISYAGNVITLKDGVIELTVGGGGTELIIKDGEVILNGQVKVKGQIKVEGDLKVAGNVDTTGNINATGDITAGNNVNGRNI